MRRYCFVSVELYIFCNEKENADSAYFVMLPFTPNAMNCISSVMKKMLIQHILLFTPTAMIQLCKCVMLSAIVIYSSIASLNSSIL